MKHLILLICLTLTTYSHATLITNDFSSDNFTAGDTVFIDVKVSDLDGDAAELDMNIGFDTGLLSFLDFTFSPEVDASALFSEAFFDGVDDALTLYVLWFDSLDVPSSNFTIGRMSFTAIADGQLNTSVNDLFVGDVNGEAINSVSGIQVNAPSSYAMFSLMLFALVTTRKRKN